MGCGRSKGIDVDFTELDRRRAEMGLSDPSENSSGRKSSGRGGPSASEIIDILAKQAKPIMDNMILSDTTPKLSKQVVATASVVKGKTLLRKEGVQRLMNVFVPPLEDVRSFLAPVFAKTQAEKNFIREALKSNFVFAACSDRELRTIVDAFEEFHFRVGEKLIVEGDVGDYFYVLKTGSVRFEMHGELVGNAGEGKTFGELSLLYSSPRTASVIADTDVTIYRVDQKTFRYIMQSQTMKTEQAKKKLLQGVKFLNFLDQSDINKLVQTMVPRVFEKGECIAGSVDESQLLYVIQEGRVRVTDNESRELGPGDYFGETALLNKHDSEKPFTAVAITRVLLLYIDKDTFEKVVGDIAALAIQARDKQILAAIPILKASGLSKPTFNALATLFVERIYPPSYTIMTEGQKTDANLYVVRSGEVSLKSQSEKEEEIIQAGGFFGENIFEMDSGCLLETNVYDTKYTMKTLGSPVVVGVLTLDCCRKVFDTTMFGKPSEKPDTPILFDDLEKHTIIGAGTFGQVWLVSNNRSGGDCPYALKIQSKSQLIKSHQASGVVHEKEIMEKLNHPFLLHLVATYQDEKFIYMLLNFVQGGELYSILHSNKRDGIDEMDVNFYASGILEGLSHMHRSHILYRDLKPENVMIDVDGYPVIIDFGFAKYVPNKTYTLCGTPLYLAPEVILNRGHDKGADHWSFGVLTYEMIEGRTPFYREGMGQIKLFKSICKGEFEFAKTINTSPEVKDLIQRLLAIDPMQRIGSLANGINEIYAHPWFSGINFGKLRQKGIEAPWIPKVKNPLDATNFESWDHLEDKSMSNESIILAVHQEIFKSF